MVDYRLCENDEFQCDNGQCIPLKYKCVNFGNERLGCADKSHLTNCSKFIIY